MHPAHVRLNRAYGLMARFGRGAIGILVGFAVSISAFSANKEIATMIASPEAISLPQPRRDSNVSVEHALLLRRTVRDFRKTPVALTDLSQILWAAQGITHPEGYRTAPSAGALYPLELYVVAGSVSGLKAGFYQYSPGQHQLIGLASEDLRARLADAALSQSWIADSAFVLVFAAMADRTTDKYGQRAMRYIHLEVGHAAQNVLLQAVALNLGAAEVGAFGDEDVHTLLRLPEDQQVLYLIPVGKP
jgi:SagB-type dehydrogenase family enzyme